MDIPYSKIINSIFLIFYLIIGISVKAQINKETKYKGKVGKTFENSKEWWPNKKKAPQGVPNIILCLIDDAGYGTSSAFGGLMQTPVFDSLANNGLRYTNFHSTGVCGPSRAALLTGRNHHSVGMGWLNYSAMGFPGYNSIIPNNKATIAEILQQNNYSTYALGKWHLTPVNEITFVGPFDNWPTGKGFEHFFGFHLGHTDQYHPDLYEDIQPVKIETTKHLTTLLADKAITYIANQKSTAPERPFFLYFAPGAIHTPHQVDEKWSDLYKGKFDKGWDWYRKEVIERQKKLGVIPINALLPDRDPDVLPWDSLSNEEKKIQAIRMEIFAGFLTHADYEFGRIISYLKEINQLQNTMIIISIGDNGSANADDPNRGWTQATNTPFRKWKVDADAEGATRQPLIIYYPQIIQEKGGIRKQYSHFIDIYPTIIDVAKAETPKVIKGHKQKPIDGISLFYSFNDSEAIAKRKIQYYELLGKRAIYNDGWKATVGHKIGTEFNDDTWELYNMSNDFNERINLATKYPRKLKKLQALFDSEAKKYNVYPLIDRSKVSIGGRKRSAFGTAEKVILYPGVDHFSTFSGPQFEGSPEFKNKSFSITANILLKSQNDEGVLFATGGDEGGLSLFVQDGKFQVAHNIKGKIHYLTSNNLMIGKVLTLKYEINYKKTFDYQTVSASPDSDEFVGIESIYINHVKAEDRNILASEPCYIALYRDGTDVGQDLLLPVCPKYKVPFAFTGFLEKVVIEYEK